jgi:hypothetical protein
MDGKRQIMAYSNGCGYCGSCGSASYSSLENIVGSYRGGAGREHASYMIAAEAVQQFNPIARYDFDNVKKEIYSDGYRSHKRVTQTYYSGVDDFLNPQRPKTVFIGEASAVKEFVEEAFSKLTGREFPDDVVIRVVSEEEMRKMHPANVLGFALNRKHLGLISEIFVKNDLLDRMMLTLGHELGHVLTRRLENERDEEAKAFAFSLAWMKTIKENNIANLSTAIRLDEPARNGLHDVALDFVLRSIKKGSEAFDVFLDIAKGIIRVGDENVQLWS